MTSLPNIPWSTIAFSQLDLSGYVAIRGQLEGPISFGLKILDENDRPLIFNDEVRSNLMDFMARQVSSQLQRLKAKHPRAFMFIDEPVAQAHAWLQEVSHALDNHN